MSIALGSFILFLLGIVAFQDFKTRSVYWFVFPLLFISAVLFNYEEYCSLLVKEFLFNQFFVIFQFALISIYFALKHKKMVNITHSYIGWGDILFLLSIAPLFCLSNYIIFYVFSLLFALIFYYIYFIFSNSPGSIPLAGLQALFLICILLMVKFSGKAAMLQSDFLLQWLFK